MGRRGRGTHTRTALRRRSRWMTLSILPHRHHLCHHYRPYLPETQCYIGSRLGLRGRRNPLRLLPLVHSIDVNENCYDAFLSEVVHSYLMSRASADDVNVDGYDTSMTITTQETEALKVSHVYKWCTILRDSIWVPRMINSNVLIQ